MFDEFSNNKGRLFGKHSVCKQCDLKSYKEYYKDENVKKRARERSRKWYEDNREQAREYRKQYHIDNAEAIQERVKQWRIDNPEKYREQDRRWYEKNRELVIQKSKDWYENNREQFNYTSKLSRQRRRARLEALPDNLTAKEFDLIHSTFDNKCYFT